MAMFFLKLTVGFLKYLVYIIIVNDTASIGNALTTTLNTLPVTSIPRESASKPDLTTVDSSHQLTTQTAALEVSLNFLEGFVGIQQSFASIAVCSKLCRQINSCKSINFSKTRKICHINNERANTTDDMKWVPGFVYKDVNDIDEKLAGNCKNNTCSLSDMCVPHPNNGNTCIHKDRVGYSTEPNNCTEMECNSFNGGYTEYNITGLGNVRVVVSMSEVTYSAGCVGSNRNVPYGWKERSVFVDGGCSGKFRVCFTVI